MKLRNAIELACTLTTVFPSSGVPPDISEKVTRIQTAIGQITQFDLDDDPLAETAYG